MQYTPKEKPGARNKKKAEGKSNPKLRYAAITSNNSLTRVALLVEILHICGNNKLKQVTAPSDKPPTGGRKTETPFVKSHRQPQKKTEIDLRPTGGESADYPGAAALEVAEHLLHRPRVVPWVHSERRIAGFGRCRRRFAAVFVRRISGWCLLRAEEV
jgi:hypothetical protein